MRTPAEDNEVTRLLREYDRIVVRLGELGVDTAKARPHDLAHYFEQREIARNTRRVGGGGIIE